MQSHWRMSFDLQLQYYCQRIFHHKKNNNNSSSSRHSEKIYIYQKKNSSSPPFFPICIVVSSAFLFFSLSLFLLPSVLYERGREEKYLLRHIHTPSNRFSLIMWKYCRLCSSTIERERSGPMTITLPNNTSRETRRVLTSIKTEKFFFDFFFLLTFGLLHDKQERKRIFKVTY